MGRVIKGVNTYLGSLHDELQEQSPGPVLLTVARLDQALLARLSAFTTGDDVSIFGYLVSCWNRASSLQAALTRRKRVWRQNARLAITPFFTGRRSGTTIVSRRSQGTSRLLCGPDPADAEHVPAKHRT